MNSLFSRNGRVGLTTPARAVGVFLTLVLIQYVPGCGKAPPATKPMSITSADPNGDAAAYQASERQLTEVRWHVIERKGPRPVWDRMGNQIEKETTGSALQKENESRLTPTRTVEVGSTPYTPAPATTQPSTQPAPLATLNEDELPVKVIELPDGKLRMIWILRSYGGSNVTSARDASTARRTVAITPPDLAPIVAVMTQVLGANGAVTPLPRENTLVVTCERNMRSSVLHMLDKLDTPLRQVQISAKIFEVSRDFDFQQGAQVLAQKLGGDTTGQASSVFNTPRFLEQLNSGTPFQGSVVQFMKVFEEAGVSVDTSIQILAEAGMIKLVSAPRMTVAAGQTGYMLAGQELPIQSSSIVNGLLSISTQYKPVGVQLYITPQAIGPDRVKLHTISIVSNINGFTPLPKISGSNPEKMLVNPIIDSREAETAVTVNNGDTLVISGLRMSRTTTRENKVPGLGDIPLLGWLFKNHRSQQQMTDLYFFVTPTLL